MRVGGFNVYGLWEAPNNPDAQPYFADPTNPKPAAPFKKEWLITRRYSKVRDIDSAFGAAELNSLLESPPWFSVWHRQDDDQWLDGTLKERADATRVAGDSPP